MYYKSQILGKLGPSKKFSSTFPHNPPAVSFAIIIVPSFVSNIGSWMGWLLMQFNRSPIITPVSK